MARSADGSGEWHSAQQGLDALNITVMKVSLVSLFNSTCSSILQQNTNV